MMYQSSNGGWENSSLCLEDGIEPAASTFINLQGIYNQCLEGEYMASEECVKYCKCGCGTQIPAIDKWGRHRKFVNGHGTRGRQMSNEQKQTLSVLHKGKTISEQQKEILRKRMSGKKNPNYGIKMSNEQKQTLSLAHTGKKLTNEHKNNISSALIGNHRASGYKHSDKTKSQVSSGLLGNTNHLGHKHTNDAKNKMSESHTGDKNHNWRGGISFEPYCPKFNDEFKEEIRNIFDRKCFLCDKLEIKNGRKLSIHHVNYNKDCLCDDIKCDFVPLCMSCHTKTNHNRNYWENNISEKLQKNN